MKRQICTLLTFSILPGTLFTSLNLNIEALSTCSQHEIPPEITQMLLNLHAIHDGGNSPSAPSEEYVQLEGLLSKVVCPFLGSKGLYLHVGEEDPAIPARDPNAKENGSAGGSGSGAGGPQGRKYGQYQRVKAKHRESLRVLKTSGLTVQALTYRLGRL